MNYRMLGYVCGLIFMVEAALLSAPFAVSLIFRESCWWIWPITMVILLIPGSLLGLRRPQNRMIFAKDGFAIVSLCWILVSVFAALPLIMSGAAKTFPDALFEMVSGFTTTGASVFTDTESVWKSVLFWRSEAHWVGGMGVLVFVMAVLPLDGARGMHILRAEIPGPSVDKLVSRAGDTARILYMIYFAMTAVEVILLLLGGVPLFDSLVISFGTAGTGGFACTNSSIAAYGSLYVELVTGVFMLLFGVNFNLFYLLFVLRRPKDVLRSEELRVYLGIVAAATISIAVSITRLCGSFWEGLRQSFFQVSSIITTTGFATADFNLWPTFSRIVLVVLMFIGACAGSTGGGLKVARIMIAFKAVRSDIRQMLHPHAVTTVWQEDKPLDEKNRAGVMQFFVVYVGVFAASVLLLSIDPNVSDTTTVFTAVAACLNNIGPGLGMVGPTGNFSAFSQLGKLLLSADMLLGRLEIYPLLIVCRPEVWKRTKTKPRLVE